MDGHVSFYKRIEWILLTLSEFVGLQSKSANVIITAPLYVLILLVWLLSFNLEGSKLLWGKILSYFALHAAPTVAHAPKMAFCACLVYGFGQIRSCTAFAFFVYGLNV